MRLIQTGMSGHGILILKTEREEANGKRSVMNVLIIEDEYNLADAIRSSLERESYQAEIETRGDTGLDKALSGTFDLVILDVMLPGMNGFDILREIRNSDVETKIIMLTARGELEDKLNGLRGGADDYLTKPFHMAELLARVDIQLKKASNAQDNKLKAADLELDMKTGSIYSSVSGTSLPVTGKEYALLEHFLRNPTQILSKEQLYTKVWGWDNTIESNNLEAYLSFIRKKLRLLKSRVTIKSVRGVGYRLEIADE